MLFPNCCYKCGKTIKEKTNARQRYCDDRCRQAAHRRDERWKADPAWRAEEMEKWLIRISSYPESIRIDLLAIGDDHGPAAMNAAYELLVRYDVIVTKLVERRLAHRDTT